MNTALTLAFGFALLALPAHAASQVEEGDPLAACTGGAKTESATADRSGQDWGVEIAAFFEKQQTLEAFDRVKDEYKKILGDYSPAIVEVCDLSMGTDLRYSARIGFDDRKSADKLCDKLQAAGGAYVVVKN